MRISDRLIPAALFTVGLGLVSAFGFEGTGARDGMRDGMAPAAAVDTIPRATQPAPGFAPPMAVPNVPAGANANLNTSLPATRPLTRSLTPTHPLTPGEAFLTGTEALRAGNTTAGIHALEYAAENGHALAEWKLGRMYADGDHVTRDDLRAFDYFQDIVDNHSDDTLGTPQARFVANAYVALGSYFLNGIPNSPVKPDALRARDLYAYAASYFGDAEAQYRLGRMLLEGQGGPRDPWQAARWLKLAADKRHTQAQALLGITMFKGDGIPRQAARGLMYLIVAHDAARQDKAIADLQAWAFANASDDERAMALTYLESWAQGRRD
ncbi:MAG TPA: tetratricopeptide repeat protein [Xanthobacteraceae bacterium]|nr:tetratricopeptide repeat protein [Xanthobacteraceae bacterium]